MTRYTSTLGPFMLTRLAVIVLGAQFAAAQEQAETVAMVADKPWMRGGPDYVSLEPCEMCREPFHPSALDCEPYGRICEDCYWSLPD